MCGLSCAAPLSFVLLHWELCVWWSQFVYISSQYGVCNTYPTVLDCAFCAELRVMDLKTLSYIHLCRLSIWKNHVKTTSIPYDTTNLYWGSSFFYIGIFFSSEQENFFRRKHLQVKICFCIQFGIRFCSLKKQTSQGKLPFLLVFYLYLEGTVFNKNTFFLKY
jgi:hypothetical protein